MSGYDANDTPQSEGENAGPVHTDDSIVPVTIKMLRSINYEKGKDIILDKRKIKIVSVVGKIVDQMDENIGSKYVINDGTGEVEVQDYTESTNEFDNGDYVYICGRLNAATPYVISAFSVKPVKDHNQIPFHMIQACFVHLYNTKGPHEKSIYVSSAAASTVAKTEGSTTLQQSQRTSQKSGDDLTHQILTFLGTFDKTNGASQDEIIKHLSHQYSVEAITTAIDTLSYSGEIYPAAESGSYALC